LDPDAKSISPGDLRFSRLRAKAGSLFVIAVDASGSMATERIAAAKSLALELLTEAYVRRDQVMLLAFQRAAARVVLPATPATQRARLAIRQIPAGGGTPLSAGILLMMQQALQARVRLKRPVQAILFSDGRANVSLNPDEHDRNQVFGELRAVAERYRDAAIRTLVVDTTLAALPSPNGHRLAAMLHANYLRC
jgi:magnesium chelatase subunit D